MAFSSKLVTLNRLKTAFSQFITSCTGKPSDASSVSGATLAAKINTLNNGYASSAGKASSADKLNANAGDADHPVYFSNGKPVQCNSIQTGASKVRLYDDKEGGRIAFLSESGYYTEMNSSDDEVFIDSQIKKNNVYSTYTLSWSRDKDYDLNDLSLWSGLEGCTIESENVSLIQVGGWSVGRWRFIKNPADAPEGSNAGFVYQMATNVDSPSKGNILVIYISCGGTSAYPGETYTRIYQGPDDGWMGWNKVGG